MKNTNIKSGANRRFSWRAVALAAMGIFAIAGMTAQNSLPAPGSGGSFNCRFVDHRRLVSGEVVDRLRIDTLH